MLADGRLSAQAVLVEYHLLSWATISVPLLPIWFWSAAWKHLAFVSPFCGCSSDCYVWAFSSCTSVIQLLLLHLYRSQLSMLLLSYACTSDGILHSPVVFRLSFPMTHSILGVEQCSFETFQASIVSRKLKNCNILCQTICFSNLGKWSW